MTNGQPPGATTEIVATAGATAAGEVRGTVRVAPAVLIELIELTVCDVPGVMALRPHRRAERPAPGSSGDGQSRTYDDGKVQVRVRGDQIDADVSICVARDTNISELSRVLQRNVGVAVGHMLGMTVSAVNVYVADVESPAKSEG